MLIMSMWLYLLYKWGLLLIETRNIDLLANRLILYFLKIFFIIVYFT